MWSLRHEKDKHHIILLLLVTAYYPQEDGLVKKFNQTLIGMIVEYYEQYGSNWDEYLQRLLFPYCTKVHERQRNIYVGIDINCFG